MARFDTYFQDVPGSDGQHVFDVQKPYVATDLVVIPKRYTINTTTEPPEQIDYEHIPEGFITVQVNDITYIDSVHIRNFLYSIGDRMRVRIPMPIGSTVKTTITDGENILRVTYRQVEVTNAMGSDGARAEDIFEPVQPTFRKRRY